MIPVLVTNIISILVCFIVLFFLMYLFLRHSAVTAVCVEARVLHGARLFHLTICSGPLCICGKQRHICQVVLPVGALGELRETTPRLHGPSQSFTVRTVLHGASR